MLLCGHGALAKRHTGAEFILCYSKMISRCFNTQGFTKGCLLGGSKSTVLNTPPKSPSPGLHLVSSSPTPQLADARLLRIKAERWEGSIFLGA